VPPLNRTTDYHRISGPLFQLSFWALAKATGVLCCIPNLCKLSGTILLKNFGWTWWSGFLIYTTEFLLPTDNGAPNSLEKQQVQHKIMKCEKLTTFAVISSSPGFFSFGASDIDSEARTSESCCNPLVVTINSLRTQLDIWTILTTYNHQSTSRFLKKVDYPLTDWKNQHPKSMPQYNIYWH